MNQHEQLLKIYETIDVGGDFNHNLLNKSQVDWLLSRAEKLDKLHLDLTQTKTLGKNDIVGVSYILNCIEDENY